MSKKDTKYLGYALISAAISLSIYEYYKKYNEKAAREGFGTLIQGVR